MLMLRDLVADDLVCFAIQPHYVSVWTSTVALLGTMVTELFMMRIMTMTLMLMSREPLSCRCNRVRTSIAREELPSYILDERRYRRNSGLFY